MFDSLVESGSHKDDLARKGSFLLGAFIVYAILGVSIVVGSIYLYNTSIPDPSLELLTLVAPVPMQAEPEQQQQQAEPKPASKAPEVPMRQEISVIAPVVQSNQVAKETTKEVPRARSISIIQGDRDIGDIAAAPSGPVGPVGPGGGGGGGGGGGPVGPVTRVDDDPPPPPAPKPTPAPKPPPSKPVSGGVLTGKAVRRVQPQYPAIAKAARASGTVTVQVTVSESGDVISAVATGGHPLLQQAAVAAVRQWKFSPTLLSGQPVKVTGVVTVNFTLQ